MSFLLCFEMRPNSLPWLEQHSIPIQDNQGSLVDEPLPPSGNVSSVDICESTDSVSLDPCEVQKEGPPSLPMQGPELKDCIPPSGRDLPSVLHMAASGAQPAGDALPSLFPSHILTMEDHVNFATILNPIKDLVGAATPKSSWEVGKELCANPKAVIGGRLSGLKFLSDMSEKLREQNRRWVARLPEGSPSKGTNFALIQFLCSHLDYPDKSLVADLPREMPVVGIVPESGVFRKRVRKTSVTLPEWREGLLTRNQAMVERARQAAGTEVARLCWEKTMREVEKGWATQPVPVTDAIPSSVPLSHRFDIEEEHGGSGFGD